jgi:hypothetical protein
LKFFCLRVRRFQVAVLQIILDAGKDRTGIFAFDIALAADADKGFRPRPDLGRNRCVRRLIFGVNRRLRRRFETLLKLVRAFDALVAPGLKRGQIERNGRWPLPGNAGNACSSRLCSYCLLQNISCRTVIMRRTSSLTRL